MLDYESEMKVDELFYQADIEEEMEDLSREIEDDHCNGYFLDECTPEEYEEAMKDMEEYYASRDLAYERVQEALEYMKDMTDPISDVIKAILKGEPHD